MPTLVEQIQREALDEGASVSNLLRKVKLAAMKLGLDKVEDWVEHELSGYTAEVPPYRRLRGQPMAFNPMRGWIPLVGEDIELLSVRSVGQPISGIEDVLRQSPDGELQVPFPPSIVSRIDRSSNYSFGRYTLSIDRGQVASIVDAVRNAVLDWAMNLERAGITGSEFSFTVEEKSKAKDAPVTWNIGSIGSVGGSVGSDNVTGDITIGSVNVDQSKELLAQIRARTSDLVSEGVHQVSLKDAISRLETACRQPKPSHGAIKGLWTDLRNVISGAGGGIVSSGVVALIAKMLGGQ